MKDYQESQFQVLEYKIQDISANSESPNIIFAGFRYSDSANVVGTITEKMKLLSIMVQQGTACRYPALLSTYSIFTIYLQFQIRRLFGYKCQCTE